MREQSRKEKTWDQEDRAPSEERDGVPGWLQAGRPGWSSMTTGERFQKIKIKMRQV